MIREFGHTHVLLGVSAAKLTTPWPGRPHSALYARPATGFRCARSRRSSLPVARRRWRTPTKVQPMTSSTVAVKPASYRTVEPASCHRLRARIPNAPYLWRAASLIRLHCTHPKHAALAWPPSLGTDAFPCGSTLNSPKRAGTPWRRETDGSDGSEVDARTTFPQQRATGHLNQLRTISETSATAV